MIYRFAFIFCFATAGAWAQVSVHLNAHAHNDYEHHRPLFDALQNGFNSVEADVHLFNNKLLVGHDGVNEKSPSLEKLYFTPLDSLIKQNDGRVYKTSAATFYLMIDVKTDAEKTYRPLQVLLNKFPSLKCSKGNCPVKIFLSGNRPIDILLKQGYTGFGLDGRPEDIGEGFSTELMPVISDTFANWSKWTAQSPASIEDLSRIRELAKRIHAEGKLFRLWATPDNELAWKALLDAGVDLINTDKLMELSKFLNTTVR